MFAYGGVRMWRRSRKDICFAAQRTIRGITGHQYRFGDRVGSAFIPCAHTVPRARTAAESRRDCVSKQSGSRHQLDANEFHLARRRNSLRLLQNRSVLFESGGYWFY